MTLSKTFRIHICVKNQSHVLNEIATGFASGCKYIVLEAPTGFGESAVAINVALTLGTGYFCTSTVWLGEVEKEVDGRLQKTCVTCKEKFFVPDVAILHGLEAINDARFLEFKETDVAAKAEEKGTTTDKRATREWQAS